MFRSLVFSLLFLCHCAVGHVVTGGHGKTRLAWYPDAKISLSRVPNVQRVVNKLLGDPGDQFYAQPIVYDGLVFLASLKNNIYQLDSTTGQVYRNRFLDIPFDIARDLDPTCRDLSIQLNGVLSTPVLDTTTNTLYFVSKTYKPGTSSGLENAIFKLHAIDFRSWAVRPNFPVVLQGTNGKGLAFEAGPHLQRPALLLHDNKIIVSFGSNCDLLTYYGWAISVHKTSGAILNLWANAARNAEEYGASFWQSGVGPSARRAGEFFAVTGNAFNVPPSPPAPGRDAAKQSLTNSIIRFKTSNIQPVDFFTPDNVEFLDEQNLDFGGSGLMLLPTGQFGNAAHPEIGVTAAKDGFIYVVDTKDLGGFKAGPGESNNIVQKTNLGGTVRSGGAALPSEKMIYYVGQNVGLQAFKYDGSTGLFEYAGGTVQAFGSRSGSPAVTSTGNTLGTGVVWLYDVIRSSLVAFRARPDGQGLLQELFSIGVNPCKFSSPSFADGKVYIATCDGRFNILA